MTTGAMHRVGAATGAGAAAMGTGGGERRRREGRIGGWRGGSCPEAHPGKGRTPEHLPVTEDLAHCRKVVAVIFACTAARSAALEKFLSAGRLNRKHSRGCVHVEQRVKVDPEQLSHGKAIAHGFSAGNLPFPTNFQSSDGILLSELFFKLETTSITISDEF